MKRRTIRIDAVYDIETENFDRFLACGIWFADGHYESFSWSQESKAVDRLLSIRGTIWAHNGGAFDHLWLIDRALKVGKSVSLVAAGTRIVRARIGRLQLCDSMALCPVTLEELTGRAKERPFAGRACVAEERCGEACRGFCHFRRGMGQADLSDVMGYMRADCESLFVALTHIAHFAEENDLDLGFTIGGSAWRDARRKLSVAESAHTYASDLYARQGYFGGRSQVIRPTLAAGFEADVRACYPHKLESENLPVGDPVKLFGPAAARAYAAGRDGVYIAEVRVPEMLFPPLPVRTERRTAYPTGRFGGAWTGVELRHAEAAGASVLAVREGLVYPRSARVFGPWVRDLFAIREKTPKGPLKTFVKVYANSLTGKLGMRPEATDYFVGDAPPAAVFNRIGQRAFIWQRPHLHACGHVEWAGHLTAAGRAQLGEQARHLGDSLAYCDTDGVIAGRDDFIGVGTGLGDWRELGRVSNVRALGVKMLALERDGREDLRAKGIDRRFPKRLYEAIRNGSGVFENVSVEGFQKAFKRPGKLLSRTQTRRSISESLGDRILLPEGITRAPTYEELSHGETFRRRQSEAR